MRINSAKFPQYLQDYEKQEDEITSKLKDIFRKKISAHESCNNKDFFPEFKLGRPYTFLPYQLQLPNVLPFYRSIIVDIYPYINEKKFALEYGVTVDQLVSLIDEKHVFIRIEGFLEQYASLPYLKPFFQYNPPNSSRFNIIYSQKDPINYQNTWQEIADKIQTIKPNPYYNNLTPEYFSSFDLYVHGTPIDYIGRINTYTNFYFQFKAMYGNDQANEIFNFALNPPMNVSDKWNFFRETITSYANYFLMPNTHSLGGVHLIDKETIQRTRNNNPPPNAVQFPFDVGITFMKTMELRLPQDLDIALEYNAKRWQNALNSYEDAVMNRQNDDLTDRANAIEEENNAISHDLDDMIRKRKLLIWKTRKYHDTIDVSINLALIGAYLTQRNYPYLMILKCLSNIAGKFEEQPIDALLKFDKPHHTCLSYDIKQKMN